MKSFYALYDKKIEEFNFPFHQPDDKTALVTISRQVEYGSDMFSKCPQDFVLYRVFDFDTKTGAVTPVNEKVQDLAEVYHDRA